MTNIGYEHCQEARAELRAVTDGLIDQTYTVEEFYQITNLIIQKYS